jgi:4-oxalocrotonate tautomerase
VPYINVRLIDDQVTAAQKSEVIRQITQVMVDVLGKDPNTTFVVIDEVSIDNWGLGGQSVRERRRVKAESGAK